MSTSATPKHILDRIGLVCFVPEVTKGTPNWNLDADDTTSGGPIQSTTVTYVDTATGSGAHDLALNGAADDLFIGMLLYAVDGANAGAVVEITDFAEASSAAVFTHTAWASGSPVADTNQIYLIGPLQASDASFTPHTENVPREGFARQTLDGPSSLKGKTFGTGSFNFEPIAMEVPSTSSAAATMDGMSQFLRAIGTRRVGVGTTFAAGWNTVTGDVADASGLLAGDYIMGGTNNEIRRITSISTNTLVTAPPWSTTPINTETCLPAEQWVPADTGHQSHTILYVADDTYVEFKGCVFSFGLTGEIGGKVMASAEFDCGSWSQNSSAFTVLGQQSARRALEFKASGVHHFSTTALGITSFEWTLGHGRTELFDTAAGNLYFASTRESTMSVTHRDQGESALALRETWESSGTIAKLIIAVGNATGAAVGVGGQAQVQDPSEYSSVNEFRHFDTTFAFVDNQESAATAEKPIFFRF